MLVTDESNRRNRYRELACAGGMAIASLGPAYFSQFALHLLGLCPLV